MHKSTLTRISSHSPSDTKPGGQAIRIFFDLQILLIPLESLHESGLSGNLTHMNRASPDPKPQNEQLFQRAHYALSPVLAGILLDLFDAATFGPIGLIIGLPFGTLIGYWMAKCLRLSPQSRFWVAMAAGIYCTIPMTELLPLGTLAGAWARFSEKTKSAGLPPENEDPPNHAL
jgi:hypothetical protein